MKLNKVPKIRFAGFSYWEVGTSKLGCPKKVTVILSKTKYNKESSNLEQSNCFLPPTLHDKVALHNKTKKYNKSPKISIIGFNDWKFGVSRYGCHKKTAVILSKAKHNEESLNLVHSLTDSNLPNNNLQQANRDKTIKHNRSPKINIADFSGWKVGASRYVIPKKTTIILNGKSHSDKSLTFTQNTDAAITANNDEFNRYDNTAKQLSNREKIMKFNKSPKINFMSLRDFKADTAKYIYHKKTTVILNGA